MTSPIEEAEAILPSDQGYEGLAQRAEGWRPLSNRTHACWTC